MKFSIITAVLNRADTIADCIESVRSQTLKDVEHIIIDGGSTDGTLDVIEQYADCLAKVVSEPDQGLFFAVNKGLRLATGEVVGILNADDMYASPEVLSLVAQKLSETGAATCYGDLLYVQPGDTSRVVRYWRSGTVRRWSFRLGWMPPHPTFFVRRHVYERSGLFNTDFRIAADYELMLRFLEKHRVSTAYVPEVLVKMRTGGQSNGRWRNMPRKSAEDYLARKVNGLRPRAVTILLKNLRKLPQFVRGYYSASQGGAAHWYPAL